MGIAPVLAFAPAGFVHLLLPSSLLVQRDMAHNPKSLPDIPNSVSCSGGKSGEQNSAPCNGSGEEEEA